MQYGVGFLQVVVIGFMMGLFSDGWFLIYLKLLQYQVILWV